MDIFHEKILFYSLFRKESYHSFSLATLKNEIV